MKLHHTHVKFFGQRQLVPYTVDAGIAVKLADGREIVGADAKALFTTLKAMPEREARGASQFSGDVIAPTYRERYKAENGCGDDLMQTLREKFCDAKGQLLVEAFKAWATRLGLWADKYDALNNGMKRMNVGNKVRAALKAGTLQVEDLGL